MLFLAKRLLMGSLGLFLFRAASKLLLQLLLYLALMVIFSGLAGSVSHSLIGAL